VAAEREMIINVSAGDECRIAVLEGGRLEELFIERQSAESHVSSIFKGRVTNVEPSIQAVFVDFGHAKNGFLHISDVHPQYFPSGGGASEDVGKKIPRRDRPPIQKCFRRGQEVVVQVTKEGIGTKGPTLTTYLSIPGRFLVMMPGMSRLGVSRKIEDENDRRSMREMLGQLDLPEGLGFIVRTAGLGRTKREMQRDLNYLNRLWKIISDRIRKVRPPAEVYQESDLVIRTIRDVLTSDFQRIVVDHEPTAQKAREFLKIALPRSQDLVQVSDGHEPIFHKFGIEEEIERINSRHVPLPLGGSLVIDTTEAMVTIDVNSGKFRDVDDAEESAYKLNLQAAEEIARQLRLRDLGGLIVCDFIDMRMEKHKRAVERTLRNALRKHKERARLLRMSAFGLIEITRQRQRTSIRRSIYAECPHCKGSGMVKSAESMVLEVMRVLQLACHQQSVRKVLVIVSPEVAFLVQNSRRAQLHDLEIRTGTTVTVRGEPQYALDQLGCECEDVRGRPVAPST
jgi:ribonuclease E